MSSTVNPAHLSEALSHSRGADSAARALAKARLDDILRPTGALERLDSVALHLAAWHGDPAPRVRSPAALIFAADHGVAAEGVSAYPSEVTGAMLAAFEASRATVTAMAATVGATVRSVDVGVGRPTGNLRVEPALNHERFSSAFEVGRQTVRDAAADGADLLIFGEMGIGNTTAASAVTAALLGGDVTDIVGRGTGVSDDAYANKTTVVSDALKRIADVTQPLEILREVGGAELVAIAGAIVESRLRGVPVLLDGFIASTPALALHHLDPRWIEHAIAGHVSAEQGHVRILEALGLEPLLALGLRLGEGSGAMAALPLLDIACAALVDVATFTEWFGDS